MTHNDTSILETKVGDEDDIIEMKIEEHRIGDYKCPKFILSEKEEKCIVYLWMKGVIVKRLGKRIGFKALKNRLNQMWAMNEILNIFDLVQEYYMVSFISEEGQYTTLM